MSSEHLFDQMSLPSRFFTAEVIQHLMLQVEPFSPQTIRNIDALRQHLEGNSVVICHNHPGSLKDGPWAMAFSGRYFADQLRAIGSTVGQKHADPSRYPVHARVFELTQQLTGAQIFPLIQHNDDYPYPDSLRLALGRQFLRGSKDILSQPGGVLLMAPEGTRGEDGTLQPGQPGIKILERSLHPSYAALAIIPATADSCTRLELGPVFTGADLDAPDGYDFSDRLMLKLAELLPPHLHGHYSRSNML